MQHRIQKIQCIFDLFTCFAWIGTVAVNLHYGRVPSDLFCQLQGTVLLFFATGNFTTITYGVYNSLVAVNFMMMPFQMSHEWPPLFFARLEICATCTSFNPLLNLYFDPNIKRGGGVIRNNPIRNRIAEDVKINRGSEQRDDQGVQQQLTKKMTVQFYITKIKSPAILHNQN
ncbi:hypothetical protein TL16_g12865 [Triparma laevis f. inornata]|uniref:Uncharacterized protein n=2 Tax=Triparma laevis TaxID=1534972 RepID=A0A9W6ZGN3_9STRA|nr:hypothetical protein TrLO_g14647 [Triparma laevis f. longispina]GMH94288.1 hypothetical protein TL16_g12865 [Triparma laevis f. inornata]